MSGVVTVAPDGSATGSPGRLGGVRPHLAFFIEALAVFGLAVTQPVLDLLSVTPEVFVFRGATSRDIVVLAVAVAVVPALVLWVVEVAVALAVPSRADLVRAVLLAAVVFLAALVWIKDFSALRGAPAVVLALALAVGFRWVHQRYAAVRLWTLLLAGAVPVFVLMALLSSPLTPLVRDDDVDVADIDLQAAPPIVFIVFDELPTASLVDAEGRIDADLYPSFAALAGDSTWYRNATSLSTSTLYAVPSLLTGNEPVDGVAPYASSQPESLFTWLGGVYEVNAIETWTRMCPSSVCGAPARRPGSSQLIDDAIRTWWDLARPDDAIADPVAALIRTAQVDSDSAGEDEQPARSNDPVEAQIDQFVSDLRPGAFPELNYLHVLLPHQPWSRFPSGRQYETPNEKIGRPFLDEWMDEQWPVTLGRQRHLLQVQSTDAQLGRILDALRSDGLYDRALIVVTSDHGVSFEPGELSRGDGPDMPEETWGDLVGVPLLIKAPQQSDGIIDDRNVATIDVLPTIAELLGLDLPWEVDGVALTEDAVLPADKTFFQARVDWNERRTTAGERRVVPASDAAEQLRTRSLDSFALDRSGSLGLFEVGPGAELIGRPITDFEQGSASGLTASIDGPADPSVIQSEPLPALIRGSVTGAGAQEALVAVVVGETVVGVSSTFAHRDADTYWAVLAPEELLPPGPLELRLYELDDTVLRPIAVS